MATLVQRPDSAKKYQVRWYDHTGARRSRQFTAKKDAQAFLLEIERAKDTGKLQLVGADKETLSMMGGKHFAAIKHDLAVATRKGYALQWNRHVITHPIASTPLRSITPQTVEDFKSGLRVKGAGEQSIRACLMLIQAVLNRAVNEGVIAYNAAAAVRKPSPKRQLAIEPVTPEAVEMIRAEVKPRDALLISVLAYAGVRPGEARALQWRYVRANTLLVEAGTNPDGSIKGTKTGQLRSVPLNTALKADLAGERGDAQPEAFIFARSDGKPQTEKDWQNWRTRKFKPAVSAAGVSSARPYDLRHCCASMWLREGISPIQVASWLGHSPAILLSTYTHVIADLDPSDRRTTDELIAAARGD